VLLYAKGGFAWANNKTTFRYQSSAYRISDSHTHTGYTLGGGRRIFVHANWSAKAEYMFTSLGSETYNLLGEQLPSGNIDFHTIKVGVNYHFR
jgi:outer membrane immunogenic protein